MCAVPICTRQEGMAFKLGFNRALALFVPICPWWKMHGC